MGHTVGFAADPFGFVADLLADHGVEDAVGLDVVGMDDLYVLAHPDHVERAFVTDRDSVVKGGEFEAAFGDAVIAAASVLALSFLAVPALLFRSPEVSDSLAWGVSLVFSPFFMLPVGLLVWAALSRL